MRLITIITTIFILAVLVYSSDTGGSLTWSFSDSTNELASHHQNLDVSNQKIISLNNKASLNVKPINNTIITRQTSLSKYENSQKSKFQIFLKEHKEQLIVTGIGLAASLASGIFDRAAHSQYDKEKELYELYIGASKNSDFDTLWNEYNKAREKTDRYLNLRGIFGISTGAIGASLLISLTVEGSF